jgi:multisubunit Na+/H+ antiporter MnhB subunit
LDNVDLGVADYALAAALGLAGLAILFRRGRLELVLNLGLVGMLVAAVFALYSAPDLAITQIVVELLMVVLFVLGLRRMLRMFNFAPSRRQVLGPAVLSVAFGAMITVLLLSVLVTPQHPSISPFFVENTETVAKAKNVVNTILVDFRGFDTLGEIMVVALAALATFAMVRALKERG